MNFKAFSSILLVGPSCSGQISTGKAVTQVCWNCVAHMLGIQSGWYKEICSIFYQDIHIGDYHRTPEIQVTGNLFFWKGSNIRTKIEKASYKFKDKVVTSG